MSRFNFLNPVANITPASEPATGGASVPASRSPRKAKPRPGEDDVAVLATLPDGTELRENRTRQGVEIRFAAKPADGTLAALKAAGWRWSRFSGVWYAADSAQRRHDAKAILAGIHPQFMDGAPAATPTPPAPPTTVAPVDAETNAVPAPVAPAPSIPRLTETKTVVILDNPPPGGWTEADKVPDQYRRQPTSPRVDAVRRPCQMVPHPTKPDWFMVIEPGDQHNTVGETLRAAGPRPHCERWLKHINDHLQASQMQSAPRIPPQIAPMKGFRPLGLPQRPKPF
jgi:hypothetical protein